MVDPTSPCPCGRRPSIKRWFAKQLLEYFRYKGLICSKIQFKLICIANMDGLCQKKMSFPWSERKATFMGQGSSRSGLLCQNMPAMESTIDKFIRSSPICSHISPRVILEAQPTCSGLDTLLPSPRTLKRLAKLKCLKRSCRGNNSCQG